jgi:hypothetical protein
MFQTKYFVQAHLAKFTITLLTQSAANLYVAAHYSDFDDTHIKPCRVNVTENFQQLNSNKNVYSIVTFLASLY